MAVYRLVSCFLKVLWDYVRGIDEVPTEGRNLAGSGTTHKSEGSMSGKYFVWDTVDFLLSTDPTREKG